MVVFMRANRHEKTATNVFRVDLYPHEKLPSQRGNFIFHVSVPPRKWCQIHRFVSQENKFNSLEFMLYHEGPVIQQSKT